MRVLVLAILVAGCNTDPCGSVSGNCIAIEINNCNCGPKQLDQIELVGPVVQSGFGQTPQTPSSFNLPASFAIIPAPNYDMSKQLLVTGMMQGNTVSGACFQGPAPSPHTVWHRVGSGGSTDDCLCGTSTNNVPNCDIAMNCQNGDCMDNGMCIGNGLGCPTGGTCMNGQCMGAPGCMPNSCNGCCDGNTCVPLGSMCNVAGFACVDPGNGGPHICTNGACNNCGGSNCCDGNGVCLENGQPCSMGGRCNNGVCG
jgi:hypothetical protein